MGPQHGILGAVLGRVSVNHSLCDFTDELQQLAVAGNVGNLQVEGDTALLRSLQVTGTAKLQSASAYLEAVVGVDHDSMRFARLLRQPCNPSLNGCNRTGRLPDRPRPRN